MTGVYDQNTVGETSASLDEIGEAGTVYTQCAHIVPESTYFNVSGQDPNNTKVRLYLFFYIVDVLILASSTMPLQSWQF